jgi:hypothetical protein
MTNKTITLIHNRNRLITELGDMWDKVYQLSNINHGLGIEDELHQICVSIEQIQDIAMLKSQHLKSCLIKTS